MLSREAPDKSTISHFGFGRRADHARQRHDGEILRDRALRDALAKVDDRALRTAQAVRSEAGLADAGVDNRLGASVDNGRRATDRNRRTCVRYDDGRHGRG